MKRMTKIEIEAWLATEAPRDRKRWFFIGSDIDAKVIRNNKVLPMRDTERLGKLVEEIVTRHTKAAGQ